MVIGEDHGQTFSSAVDPRSLGSSENDDKQKEEEFNFESLNDIETNSVGLQKVVCMAFAACL